jgi:hypothetical protein
MPDTRTRRGPHPKDRELFSARWHPVLRAAVEDLSWLLTKGYSNKTSVKLVGDRYKLRERQRKALQRCAASDQACLDRRAKKTPLSQLDGSTVVVDGYNVLLTIEAALCGGLLLLAHDGVLRDLTAMSAHYRRIEATVKAVKLLADFFTDRGCVQVIWYLDRPISNSGRLKRLILEIVADRVPPWRVDLTDRTDTLLIQSPYVVASADSAVIDGCHRWVNLARAIVDRAAPDAWVLDLGAPPESQHPL